MSITLSSKYLDEATIDSGFKLMEANSHEMFEVWNRNETEDNEDGE